MKQNLHRFQLLMASSTKSYVPVSVNIHAALKRLERLMLDAPTHDVSNLPIYAMKYIEWYHDDVLQLEVEWEVLYAALITAWQHKDYKTVVTLVEGTARSIGRICSLVEAEQLLHMGIEASHHLQDDHHYIHFLNRRGGLLFAHGSYWLGRQVWSMSLRLANSSPSTFGLWQPFSSFVYVADILGNYNNAKQFVEALYRSQHADDPDCLAVALFIRGFYARLMHEQDNAKEDFNVCMRLLSEQPHSCLTPDARLFKLVVQTELARLEGDYAHAQACAEAALSLAQVYSDCYTVAVLLFDQGLYAYSRSQLADIPAIFLRLRDVASQVNAPHIYRCCLFLGQFFVENMQPTQAALTEGHAPMTLSSAGTKLHKLLSKREQEVLSYAAVGFSNEQIATRLVITQATVKKHLEHIFLKLEVHNRTSAVAKAKSLEISV